MPHTPTPPPLPQYGSFSYSGLSILGRVVSFVVTPSAGSAGCDTPQLYLSFPGATTNPGTPAKVLKAFQKVCGVAEAVSFVVSDADVSRWDAASGAWVVVHGVFGVSVGA